ncbi:hypothetical protein FRX31_012356 [Thalictrum thalictroides]|uniref:Endonuclease/exonuclease/phosphatase domain-containing protein n=1 Tax=Thalictrum thalictroides TaxID=46969 RepID=A0A7J6WL19_THATH|nr:hypothetical protein FRX31_012356 [Thalictrum thalictroides]
MVSDKKYFEVVRYGFHSNFGVLAVQETGLFDSRALQRLELLGRPFLLSQFCGLIFYSPHVSVISSSTLLGGRVILAHIQFKEDPPFHIASVYAPANQTQATAFYKEMAEVEWPTSLVMMGDFNSWINPATDRFPPNQCRPPGSATAFRDFQLFSNLQDIIPPRMGGLKHMTWFTTSNGVFKSATCIDAILATPDLISLLTPPRAEINCISDHRTVITSLSFSPPVARVWVWISPFITSDWIFHQESTKIIYQHTALPAPWDRPEPVDNWPVIKTSLQKLAATRAKAIVAKRSSNLRAATNEVHHLEDQVSETKPPSEGWKRAYKKAKDFLDQLLCTEDKVAALRAGTRHLLEGESNSPYFLNKFKA